MFCRQLLIPALLLFCGISQAFRISWGEGSDQLGLVNLPEHERTGPLTFTVAPSGNLLVADTVNRKVKEFSAEGKFIRVFCDASPAAMAYAPNGNMLMRLEHEVTEWDPAGVFVRGFNVPDTVPLVDGYGQEVFAENGLIGVNDPDENVYLFSPSDRVTTTAVPVRKGRDTGNGTRAYTLQASRSRADTQSTVRTEILPDRGGVLGAVIYRGRLLDAPVFEVEEITPAGVKLFLKTVTPEKSGSTRGVIGRSLELPNQYFTTVYRKFEVLPGGSVWQMLTSPEGVDFVKVEATR